jgi:hypothetical protein
VTSEPIERRAGVAGLRGAISAEGRAPAGLGRHAAMEMRTRGDEEAVERDETCDKAQDHARMKPPSSAQPHDGRIRVDLCYDQAFS